MCSCVLGATVPMHWNEPNDSITWNATTGVVDMPYGTLLVLKEISGE